MHLLEILLEVLPEDALGELPVHACVWIAGKLPPGHLSMEAISQQSIDPVLTHVLLDELCL
jgi:hypothetical protein